MKKLIALLLALVMILGMAACGNSNADQPGSPAPSGSTPPASSSSDPGTSNNDVNPLQQYSLQVVEDANLNKLAGTGACPWFLGADKASARGV